MGDSFGSRRTFEFTGRWPVWVEYCVAIGLVVVAVLIRLALEPVFGDRVPFLAIFVVLMPLMMLVRPGAFLAAALIGLTLAWFLVLPKQVSFDISSPAQLTNLIGSLVLALAAFFATWMLSVSRKRHIKAADELASVLEELRNSNERYRSLFEVSVGGILTIDEFGKIDSVNPATERIFGYSSAEMVGQNVSMLMPTPYREEHDSYLHNYLESGIPKVIGIGREVMGLRKDGTEFPIELAVSEFMLSGKRFFRGAVSDITSRKAAEEAQRESEERLRVLNETLKEKVAERTAELAETYAAYQEEAELRVREEQNRIEILRRLVTGQEAERERIGRDIHDHVGQRLTALRLQLESLKTEMKTDPGSKSVAQRVETLDELAQSLDADLSHLAWELRPTALERFGLIEALRLLVKEWSKQCGVPARFEATNLRDLSLGKNVETHLFRITQEALNNIAKHARAANVDIHLTNNVGTVSLIIEDDGCGFTNSDKAQRNRLLSGLGLTGMQERAQLIGGSFEINSRKGNGTTIFVRIPETATKAAVSESRGGT